MRLLSILLLILISCTSKNDAAKMQGKIIYLNLNAEPTNLNPITSTDVYATSVQSYLLDRLMDRDPDTLEWQPGIAESFEVSEDGLTYTFKIREGVKFHDGQPLTVEDVKFSFDVHFMEEYAAVHSRSYFEKFESPTILDERTIQFTAKEKYHQNLEVIASMMQILPKHVYGDPKEGRKLTKKVVGEGPYKLKEWEKGKRIILEKNPDWYGASLAHNEGKHNFDRIIFRFVKEKNTAIEMLKKGRLDYIDMSNDPEAYMKKTSGPVWESELEKHKVDILTPKPYIYIGMNLKHPIFKDLKVRKAFAMLVNRELIAEKFYYNMWEVMSGPTYRHSEYADPDLEPIPYDPEGALKLLKQAGWSDSDKDGVLDKMIDGKKTPLRFQLTTGSKERMPIYAMIKEDAKKKGVDIDIKLIEWNSLVQLLNERNFETVALGWGGGMLNWDPKQIWHSSSMADGGSNYVSYSNKEVDALIDKAKGILDKEKRKPVLHEIYRKIAADVPYIFMLNQKSTLYANRKHIKMPKPAFKYSLGMEYWTVE